MELEGKANFYLQETKELLGKRKYKLVIDKVEKHLDRHLAIFTHQSLLSSLLLAQSRAACKLLQRNLFKKVPYRKDLILFIISIITRNLQRCQVILVTRMRRTNILSDQIGATNSYPQPQRHSFEPKEAHIRQAQAQKDQISRHVKIFLKMIKWSYGVLLLTYERHGIDLQTSKIFHFTRVMKNTYFQNLKSKILQIEVVMVKARRLHSGEVVTVEKSQELLDWSIDHILEVMHMVRLKLFRNKKDCSGCYQTKYQRIQLKLVRLLILSLVLSNRNKIRLGKTQMARSAIGVFISLFESLSISQNSFKAELHHQVDLQKRFLYYFQEKQEITTLIAPYFRREYKQLFKNNSLQQNSMVQHFNNIAFSSAIDQGMIITQCRQKLDCSQKVKKTVIQQIKNTPPISKQSNILSCHINEHVEELNTHFLKETSRINKKGPNKLEFTGSTRQSLLKKPFGRIVRNSINDINEPPSSIYQVQERTTRLLREDSCLQKLIAHKKELLKTKKNDFNTIPQLKSDITEPSLPWKMNKNVVSESLSRRKGEIAESELRNQEPFKKNQLISKQCRSADFVSILLENREELGIVKICDKIEQLSKKHVEKYESTLEQLGKKQAREKCVYKKPDCQVQNQHRPGKDEKSNYRIGAKSIKCMQEKLRLERLANIKNSQLSSPSQYFKMEASSETQSLARKGLAQWRDP